MSNVEFGVNEAHLGEQTTIKPPEKSPEVQMDERTQKHRQGIEALQAAIDVLQPILEGLPDNGDSRSIPAVRSNLIFVIGQFKYMLTELPK